MADSSIEFSPSLALVLLQSEEPFPVDFDNAWRWIGYSTKGNAKRKLEADFIEGLDYTLIDDDKRVEGHRGGGSVTFQRISLTNDCFKSFGMMAGTEQGKNIRRYFLDCEKQLKQILQSRSQPQPATYLPTPHERLNVIRLGMDLLHELGGLDDRTRLALKDLTRNILLEDKLQRPALPSGEQTERLEWNISDRAIHLGYKPKAGDLTKIGKVAAQLYRMRRRTNPPKREQFVGGTTRMVNCYGSADLDILDEAINSVMGQVVEVV